MSVGTVYLVGAGPGDPGLLTVRGLEVLRRAEVVIYDRLVNPCLLDEVPADAVRLFASKLAGGHRRRSMPSSSFMPAVADGW